MSEETDIQEEIIQGPGEQLRTARLAAGKTLEQVADALHLRASTINDLENDVYDDTVSLTFSKGYLRLYAKHLGLPEASLLEAFDNFHSKPKETAKLQSFSKRVAKQANDDRWMLVTYMILTLVLVLFLWWWWQQSNDSVVDIAPLPMNTSTAESNEPVQEPAGDNTQPGASLTTEVQPLEDQSSVLQTTDEGTDASTINISENSQQDASEPADPQALNEPRSSTTIDETALVAERGSADPQSDSDVIEGDEVVLTGDTSADNESTELVELVFTFSGDCWMNLTDATGEDIAYGIKRSGRVMTVSGVAPFEVILGAPGNVSISYDGQPVDMSGFDVTRTARFSLPLQD